MHRTFDPCWCCARQTRNWTDHHQLGHRNVERGLYTRVQRRAALEIAGGTTGAQLSAQLARSAHWRTKDHACARAAACQLRIHVHLHAYRYAG